MVYSKICLLLAFLAPVTVSTNAWYQNHYRAASSLSDNLGYINSPMSTINHLSSIGVSEYTALTHPRFPNHRVRIKKSNFCDPTVKLAFVYCHPSRCTNNFFTCSVYTGYFDVDAGAKHMFFYFFESRRDPGKGILLFVNHSCLKFAHELVGR